MKTQQCVRKFGRKWRRKKSGQKNVPRAPVKSKALYAHPLRLFMSCCARRKKVVCVLKSYTPRPDVSIPGSPVPSERAPLTEHAMRLPHSSPTLQRGEILIEWKDGTVTPLYEAWRLHRLHRFGCRCVRVNTHCFLLPGHACNLLNVCNGESVVKKKIILSKLLCHKMQSPWISIRAFLWGLPAAGR